MTCSRKALVTERQAKSLTAIQAQSTTADHRSRQGPAVIQDRAVIAVAYVIHSMQIGGAERSVARLINALDQQRFRPLVICLTQSGPAAGWIESADVPVIEIKKQAGVDPKALRRLSRTMLDYQVDVVHSYNWGTLMESAWARRQAKTPVHVHAERGSVLGAAEIRGLRMRLRGRVAGWLMRRCDAVVTNAHSVARRIEVRCGYSSEHVQVIPNGIEVPGGLLSPDQVQVRRRELGIGERAVLLGSVGRLVPVKGFDLLIEALHRLLSGGGDYHLLLVGDGPQREKLQGLARELRISDRVHLVGHQDEVGQWLSLLDIYLNTSHSEGMSQSLVEALAAGRPSIATNVGDAAVVLGEDGGCGRLIPADDIPSIVSAVESLMPGNLRALMGKYASERHATLFSAPAMSARYAAVYERLLMHNIRSKSTTERARTK